MDRAVGAEVRIGGVAAAAELHLAGHRLALLVGDRRHDVARRRQLDFYGFAARRLDRQRLFAASQCAYCDLVAARRQTGRELSLGIGATMCHCFAGLCRPLHVGIGDRAVGIAHR